MFLTVPSQGNTAEQKFIQKGEAHSTDSLLDLDTNSTVFYVGGVPTDVRVCLLALAWQVDLEQTIAVIFQGDVDHVDLLSACPAAPQAEPTPLCGLY